MKLLLISHGKFCHGVKESYEMIAGENKDIYSLDLDNQGIGVFSEKLNKLLDELTKEDEVLVLTDIQGGTPYNEAYRYKLSNSGKIEIVSGMNLPMIIEVGMSLSTGLSNIDLATMAEDVGKEAISFTSVEEDEDEDDDLEF